MSARVPRIQAIEKSAPGALVRATPAALDEVSELTAVLARDEAAWRRFVAHHDPPLRAIVRHATEPFRPLDDDEVDDVLGDFWLALVADDMRMIRAFNPTRGAALLTWLTFQLARVAYERLRRLGEEPTFVKLHEARNVPAPRARTARLRGEASSVEDAIRAVVRDAVASELRTALGSSSAVAAVPVESEGYISIAKAAEIADTHPATIRSWIRSGKLPSGRTGRHYKVRRSDVLQLIAGGEKPAAVETKKRIAEIIAADQEG
jgi:excisionase family DNA binding protein